MATAYYSTVFDHSADEVWSVIRAFDHYSWAAPGVDAEMEDGRPGDAVGGVRRVVTQNGTMRQRLLAHSDVNRSYGYEICPPVPYPVDDYCATLRVTPVVDGGCAFGEWWATFDCGSDEREHWVEYFTDEGFARWLGSLREHLG